MKLFTLSDGNSAGKVWHAWLVVAFIAATTASLPVGAETSIPEQTQAEGPSAPSSTANTRGVPAQVMIREPLPVPPLITDPVSISSIPPKMISTTPLPPVKAVPGQPVFSGGQYYRNKEVFAGGPFENVASVTVYGQLVKSVQKKLLGNEKATGWMNSDTQIAILNLQHEKGIPVTGFIDQKMAAALNLQLPSLGAGGVIATTPSGGDAIGAPLSNLARGYNVPGQPGMVYSPFTPELVIDARGRGPGEIFTDPHSNKIFQLPANFDSGVAAAPEQGAGNSSANVTQSPKKGMIPGRAYNSLNFEGQSGEEASPDEALRRMKIRRQQELEKLHKESIDR